MDLHVIWRGRVVFRSISQINIAPAVWVRILHEHIYLLFIYLFIYLPFFSFLFLTCRYRHGSAKLNMI